METKHVYSHVGRPLRIIDNLVSDKPKLFIVISIIIVSVLAVPVIIPHTSHPQHRREFITNLKIQSGYR